jgi:ATP-dependent DNA helicase RecG
VIEIMRNNPEITIAELAIRMGISDRAIKKQITKLKQQHLVRRVGPDKGGHWEVSD